jgi:hypothetical protein
MNQHMQIFVFGTLTWASLLNVNYWLDSPVLADDEFTEQAVTSDGQVIGNPVLIKLKDR